MNYEVYITDAAERDLNEAVDYIEFVLLNPGGGTAAGGCRGKAVYACAQCRRTRGRG